ncbi:DNA-directed RNA polymerase, subunit [Trema orientale]|uniref:DNA-directed RNA polymerase n=1 Tax=Trema orientale TaxID=63057 RepID=A0A2P5DJ09_TREOI|nr:DNA-directed RNA polymerase, subunit [Trema orientale]
MSYRKKKPIELFVEKDIDHDELLKDIFKDSMEQSIQSFNHFLNYEMEKIFQNSAMEYRENGRVILLRFSDVQMDYPNVIVSQVPREITPQFCRVTGTTYSCPIRVVVKHFERSENGNNLNLISKERLEIGSMPIMVRSCKCILNGKNEAELAKYGECPLDYGGYFIINGTEKVVLIQEKPSRNRIIIDTDKMGNLNASVTSIFESMEIRTVIQMENSKFYVMPNHIITRKIPLMVVMVAMGLRDQLVEMFTRNPLGEGDPRYIDLLLPSIEECTKKRIETEELALRYPGLEGNKGKIFFRDTFLIKANEDKPYLKCVYVALILRRLMDAYLHKDAKAMDDKDYLGNKRFLLSGELISLLFEDLFKALSRQAVKAANTMLAKSGRLKEDWSKDKSYLRSYCRCLRKNLTAGLERSLFTGNWNVKQFKMNQIGMTQGLSSLSYIGRLSLMTRIRPYLTNPIVSSPRALHPSELGMLCPLDATTEGKSFGLARNLALLSRISTDEKEELLVTVFHDLGVKDLQELSGEESYTAESFLVIFNGRIIGTHASPQEFATSIRRSRRKCRKVKVGKFVSVFVNAKQRCVYIASDGGRLCRPLIIVEDGVSKVKKCVKYDVVVKEGSRALDYFLRNGYIEYLDVDEENNALIALREQDITKNTTHLEIEPSTIFGACAGLIPYLHHNSCISNISQVCCFLHLT